jgi:hypothetical protein
MEVIMKILKSVFTLVVFALAITPISSMDNFFGPSSQELIELVCVPENDVVGSPITCVLCNECIEDDEKNVAKLKPCKHLMHECCFYDYATSDQDPYAQLFGDMYKRCPQKECGKYYNVVFTPQQTKSLSQKNKEELVGSGVVTLEYEDENYTRNVTKAFLTTAFLTIGNELCGNFLTLVSQQKLLRSWVVPAATITTNSFCFLFNIIESYYGLSTQDFVARDRTSTLGNTLNLFARRTVPFYCINRKLMNNIVSDLRGCINWFELLEKMIEALRRQYDE